MLRAPADLDCVRVCMRGVLCGNSDLRHQTWPHWMRKTDRPVYTSTSARNPRMQSLRHQKPSCCSSLKTHTQDNFLIQLA